MTDTQFNTLHQDLVNIANAIEDLKIHQVQLKLIEQRLGMMQNDLSTLADSYEPQR